MTSHGVRRLAAGLLACGLAQAAATGTAVAQDPPVQPKKADPFAAAKAKRSVAEQQAEADVAAAIEQSGKMAKTFPSKAVRDLKAVIDGLDRNPDVGMQKRETLVADLQARIRGIEGGGKAVPAEVDPNVFKRIEKGRKEAVEAQLEAKEVSATVAEIEKDFAANRTREMKLRVAALAEKYPTNAAVVTLRAQDLTADRIAASKDLANEMDKRFLYVMNDIQKSALPVIGDMELPKDWKEKSKRRLDALKPKISPEEEALIRSLDIPMRNNLKGAPFEEAIQSLSTVIDQKIYLDQESLKDIGIDLRGPVDVPGGVTARSALRVMLQSNGLTFVVRDNVIQVVSLEKAKKMLVTRAYYIGDIVQTSNFLNTPVGWGQLAESQQVQANAQALIDGIAGSVDPRVWKQVGGPANIRFNYASMSLIVTAPSEVHFDLYRGLYEPKKK